MGVVFKSTDRPVSSKSLWGLDTEDDSKGNVKQISLTNGDSFYHFTKRDRAIEFLFGNLPVEASAKHIYINATNLEYDLLNVFGHRLDLLTLRMKSSGSTLVSANLRGTRVHFYDTMNHVRKGVAALGKLLGLPKLKMDLTGWEYVDRDAQITCRFAQHLQRWYNELGCNYNATTPSSALDLYRRRFLPFVIHQPPLHVLDLLFSAYYGGRTEVFNVAPYNGRLFYIDVNSMYPFVMRRAFPNPNVFERKRKPNLDRFGIVHATVKVPTDTYFPPLPHRSERLLFPVGTFRGSWIYPEYAAMLERGGKALKIHGCIEFPIPCVPFRDYVDFLYPLKQQAATDVERQGIKLLLNSLYGKFGERVDVVSMVPVDRVPDDVVAPMYGDYAFIPHGTKIPNHTNVIWSAYTTGYARLLLLESMEHIAASGGTVLYCDTDSIIYGASKPLHVESVDLGGWKLEGKFSFGHFLAPKLYCLEGNGKRKYRAKGVPQSKAATFFNEGSVSYERPYRLRSILAQRRTSTYWGRFHKERKTGYTKRTVLDNGATAPIRLRQR